MNANERESIDALIEKVVGAIYEVANVLGAGFLEKVYERALVVELHARGLQAEAQAAIRVLYKGELVGDYCADILVEGKLLIELKCVDSLSNEHIANSQLPKGNRPPHRITGELQTPKGGMEENRP